MELIDIVPEFNLYEEYWKIYTKSEIQPPQYFSEDSAIERSIVGEGTNIYGEVSNSVIGRGVTIGKGTVVKDSIIMNETVIGENCELNKVIVAENVVIGDNVRLGIGEEAENETAPHIYNHGIVTVGEKSVIPNGITVGKNSVIFGVTDDSDYVDSYLASGKTLIKAGEQK
jgi:glucose-1-phosphate adenylyltransferase